MAKTVDTYQVITQSGQIVDFLSPNPDAINIFDLAKGLANVCRYSGQVTKFYSVAEHCIMVARAVPLHLKAHALIHDAAEAYIGDVPRPVKLLCPEYKQVEARVERAIRQALGLRELTPDEEAIIKQADRGALLLEAKSLKVGESIQWLDVPGEEVDDTVRCLDPAKAEEEWLFAAELLGVF
jgi:5'-deoxynucleotidase YfbR-like HD superfamily hydrolase